MNIATNSIEIVESFRNETLYYDIFRAGQFIIGSADMSIAAGRLDALSRNKWKWLCMKDLATAESPEKFISSVRSKGWHFDPIRLAIGCDDRAFLSGNVREYSAAFNYLLLCPDMTGRIMANVPDIELRDMRARTAPKIASY